MTYISVLSVFRCALTRCQIPIKMYANYCQMTVVWTQYTLSSINV